jgi:signal transduction histidine kinase
VNPLDASRPPLTRALNLIGAIATASALVARPPAPWMIPFALGILAWVTVSVLPGSARRSSDILLFVLAVAGSLATIGSNGIGVVLVAVAVLQLTGTLNRPRWQGFVAGIGSIGLIAVSALFLPFPPLGLLSIEFGVLVALLGGLNRRQQRLAEAQSRTLLEERVAIREEQARAELLAARQAVSRDIHDVLAHSLGGLVIQLDAVEALLEAGRTADAATRVHDARDLAVDGLAEARRAVGALRDDAEPPTTDGDHLAAALDDLARAHRSLGGVIAVSESGVQHPLGAGEVSALSRVLQEALTNARKHAPAAEVRVALTWLPTEVRLVVANAITQHRSPVAATGGGRGLRGMAERIAALPNASFSAEERAGTFEVSATVTSDA